MTKEKTNKIEWKGKKTQKFGKRIILAYWMKLVVVVPSSSTCTREWGGSTN